MPTQLQEDLPEFYCSLEMPFPCHSFSDLKLEPSLGSHLPWPTLSERLPLSHKTKAHMFTKSATTVIQKLT